MQYKSLECVFHEVIESHTVLLWWNATDGSTVVFNALKDMFKFLLGTKKILKGKSYLYSVRISIIPMKYTQLFSILWIPRSQSSFIGLKCGGIRDVFEFLS